MKVKDPKELARRYPHLEGCLCLDVLGVCRYRPNSNYYKILTPPGKEGPGCGATWVVRKDELEPLDGDFGCATRNLDGDRRKERRW